jgi:predicted kinase
MVGLPGSGKDTYIRHYLSDYKIVSSDDIRLELFGFEDQTKNVEVFSEMRRRTKELLKEGSSVVYNATNLSAKRRKSLANEMKKYCDQIQIVCMDVSLDELLKRNEFREERHVQESKLIQMYNSFKMEFNEYPYNQITWHNWLEA